MALIDIIVDKLEAALPDDQEFQCIPVYSSGLDVYYIQIITIWRYWDDYGVEYAIILDGPDYPYEDHLIDKMVAEAVEVLSEPTEDDVLSSWIPLPALTRKHELRGVSNKFSFARASVAVIHYGVRYVREDPSVLKKSGYL